MNSVDENLDSLNLENYILQVHSFKILGTRPV